MSDKPLITVMILSYNYGEMLKRALEACRQQTFSDFEILMINNGSTDNTEEVFLKFQKENPGISTTYLSINPNKGPSNAWNEGLKHVNGTYVMFHDADDWMDDNCLELLAVAAKETGADRVIGAYREVNNGGKLLRNRMLGKRPNPWICNMLQVNLFRAEIFLRNNIQTQCHLFDHERTMFFCAYSVKTAYVDVPCYNYLIHVGSDSKGKEQYKRIWERTWSLELLMSRFREAYDILNSEGDKCWSEYEAVRTYYIYIYEHLINAPLKVKWAEYEKLRIVMRRCYPQYLKNSKISLFRQEGDNFRSQFAVWVSATAEKLHMMKAVLLVFHLAAKFTKMYV